MALAYSIAVVYRYSSQDAHGTVLIDQYSCGMRSTGVFKHALLLLKLLLIYGSVFVSSSLRLPPSVHVNLPWGNLSHPVSFHAAVCCQARGSYIVPGATLLGAVLIWYTVNRLLQQTLLHKPLPFYGFVFVFLSLFLLLLLLLLFSSALSRAST